MILCCGETLIDMLPVTTAQGQEAFAPHPGGAVFNTAIGLGRLGVRTGLLTGLSGDMFGGQLKAALADSHVDTSCLVHTDRPTTLAFVRLSGGHASYSFFDENSAGRMLNLREMPVVPAEVSALFFGGISLACEPGADAYAALLARERSGRVVMIDPNIRPGFIADPDRYRTRLFGMIAQADIVKVSDEDLGWLNPAPLSMQEKVDTLLDRGPSLVILTRGGDGATAYGAERGAIAHVPAQKVDVVDTVGAGDTFNAGFLAHLSEHGLLRRDAVADLSGDAAHDALAYGARVAAVTVSRAGANPPWAEEL